MTRPGWYPDELIHAGAEHLDETYVPTYDVKAGVDPSDDLAKLRALGLDGSHTLVDLGAGTGTFAIAAAPYARRVVAVDVSAPMLAALRAKLEQASLANVEPVHAGFLSYEHSGEPADVVYSRHALHHLPDFWKAIALARIAAMLKPGGIFYLRDLIYAFEPGDAGATIEEWLSYAAPTPEHGWTRDELETHIRTEYSPFSWLLEPMIEHAGFRIANIHRDNPIFSIYTCVKAGT